MDGIDIEPPILNRMHSTGVSIQQGPFCWNHSTTRIIARLICIQLNICGTETSEITDLNDECDSMFSYDFDNYETFDIDKAKRACSRNGVPTDKYRKMILYVFLLYVGMNHYGCLINEGNGKRRPTTRGQYTDEVLQFYLDELINVKNESYKTHPSMQDIPREVKEQAFVMIEQFHALGKTYKLHVYSRGNIAANNVINKIKNALNHGFYISIGVNLGDSEFRDAFHEYSKDAKRPALRSMDIKNEYHSHAMVIIYYCIDKNEEMFLLKNSWPKDWGIDGTIQMRKSEILLMDPEFRWLEPTDIKQFTRDKTDRCILQGEDEIIHEVFSLRKKYKDVSSWYDNNIGKNETVNDRTLHKLYKQYVKTDLTNEEIEEMISNVTRDNFISKDDFVSTVIAESISSFKWFNFSRYLFYDIIEKKNSEYDKWYDNNIGIDEYITADILHELYLFYIQDDLTQPEVENMISDINQSDSISKSEFVDLMLSYERPPSYKWNKMINIINSLCFKKKDVLQAAGNKRRNRKTKRRKRTNRKSRRFTPLKIIHR